MLLADRVAIITGGARGIGKGIALKFAEEGCAVVIADLLIEEANKIDELREKGKKGLAIHCDVADDNQVKRTIDTIIHEMGKVDILVNNASPLPDVSVNCVEIKIAV
jgi:3-oxoacyl-[acyl-carrier protein] reductase